MLKLTYKILIIALFITTTLVLIYTAMRIDNTEHLKPSSMYFYNEYKQVYSQNSTADVIIIGNSKALSSLSSKVIQDKTDLTTYNLGYSSSNLTISKLTINTYLNSTKHKPKFCILEVSWFSFNGNRTHFHHEIASSLLFKDIEPIKYIYRYPELFQTSCLMLFSDVKLLFRNDNNKYNYIDYSSRFNKPANTILDKNEMQKTFPEYKAGIDVDLLRDLEDIISVCNANNVKLVLYDAPESPEYTMSQADKPLIKQEINKLVKKYNLNYFDFTIDGKYWHDEYNSLLSDSHHLINPDKFTIDFISVMSSAGIFNHKSTFHAN
jgi:hypothetical protein